MLTGWRVPHRLQVFVLMVIDVGLLTVWVGAGQDGPDMEKPPSMMPGGVCIDMCSCYTVSVRLPRGANGQRGKRSSAPLAVLRAFTCAVAVRGAARVCVDRPCEPSALMGEIEGLLTQQIRHRRG